MKKKQKTSILVLSFFVLVILFLFFFNRKEDLKSSVNFNVERNFEVLTPVDTLELSHSAGDLRVIDEKMFYVNKLEQKIYECSLTGEIINKFSGKGDAPYENNKIFDYDFDKSSFYTFDESKQSFNNVDFSNNVLSFYRSDNKVLRANHLKEGTFIYTYIKSRSSGINFNLIDLKNQKVESVKMSPDVFPNEKYGWWIYDGYFVRNTNNEAFYITWYTNEFIKFNKNSEIEYKKKLIHDTPRIKLKKENGMLFPVNDNQSNFDSSCDDKYLYVMSNVLQVKESLNFRIIDLYQKSNGDYVKSYRIPSYKESLPIGLEVYKDKLYLLFDESINIYNL